ncbi:MAG: cupin-like domain-containing protein [Janthinobacterium lividum]
MLVDIPANSLSDPEAFVRLVAEPCRPTVIRGLVADWPVTRAGLAGPEALAMYLKRLASDASLEMFVGDPSIDGRYFYSDDLVRFNFERRPTTLSGALSAIVSRHPDEPSIYAGSAPVDTHLPGFGGENRLACLDPAIQARIWLGNPSLVSCHYDAMDNLACVVAGERRFTLYPPEAIGSLYVGPIDHTMAGQPVSLAVGAADPSAYPRFDAIADQAVHVDLKPGDALYLPKLWWHQVKSTQPVNGLVNYWWDAFAAGPDAPYTALLLTMIAVSERPPAERRAWQAFFNHYAFRTDRHPLEHMPPEQHGILGPLRPRNYGAIRAHVMRMLRG